MIDYRNWRIWAALVIVVVVLGLLAWSHHKAYTMGAESVQTKWDAEKLDIANQSIAALETANAKAAKLVAEKESLRRAKNAEITKLSADLSAALDGLRDRPARASQSNLSGTATPGASCTGASLFADDAKFLAREAGRADRLRSDLSECQAAYSAVRGALAPDATPAR